MLRKTKRKAASLLSLIMILAAVSPMATANYAKALPGAEIDVNTNLVMAYTGDTEHTVDMTVPSISSWSEVLVEETPVATEYTPVFGRDVMYTSSTYNAQLMDSSYTLLGRFKLSFYCPCKRCNGNTHRKTASGTYLTEGRTIAVDKSVIALGSVVHIDGLGDFIAEDTGGAIKKNKIDVYVSTHAEALRMGIKYANVYVKVK